MKLNKLIVKNFRGIKGDSNAICFEGSNIIFLIGQNNVGKSSFLKAYDFFVSPKQKSQRQDFFNHEIDIPIEIEAEFIVDPISDKDDVDLQIDGKSKDPNWMSKWMDKNNKVRIKKIWESENIESRKQTFRPDSSGGTWLDRGFGGFDTLITKYAPAPIWINAMETESSLEEKINKLITEELLKKAKDEFSISYEQALRAVKKLEDEMTSSVQVKNFNINLNKRFKEVFSGLEMEITSKSEDSINLLKALEKHHSIVIKKDGILREDDFLSHGHGVIRQALFNFIAFLNEISESTDKKYILLFEEPELFLHPKILYNLRKSLYELAEKSSYQVLCASHSPFMIDISKPHCSLVRVIKNKNETTVVYQADENIFQGDSGKKEFVQMINRFNPHICEAFYADKVLLVEGDTETIVYRDLLSRFFENQEIFVLNTGSKNNIPFFQDVLTHFKIEHYIIHDTDTEFNDDGSKNSAWSLNQKIWDRVEFANNIQLNLSRRYVHTINFETANKYKYNKTKGKPLSAYEFAQTININTRIECLDWLKDIIDNKSIEHDQNYILESISNAKTK